MVRHLFRCTHLYLVTHDGLVFARRSAMSYPEQISCSAGVVPASIILVKGLPQYSLSVLRQIRHTRLLLDHIDKFLMQPRKDTISHEKCKERHEYYYCPIANPQPV